MRTPPARQAVQRLFGGHGDVIADPKAQAVILASAVLTFETAVLSPLISDLAVVFSVTEAEAGLLMLAYTTPLVVLVPLLGTLSDRYGRRYFFVPGLLVFGLAGAAIGLVHSFEAALALRGLQAVGYAAAGPIAIALLGDLYGGARETTVQGLRTAGINVSNIAVPVLAVVLFAYSWRYPFGLYLLTIPIGVWAWAVLPDVETSDERTVLAYLSDLATLFRDPTMALLVSSFVVRYVLLFGFLTYISVLAVRSAGLAVAFAGGVVALKGVVSLLSSTQTGRFASRFDPVLLTLVGFALCGAGFTAMGAAPSAATIVAGTILYGAGDGVVSPSQKSLVNQLAPADLRGGAVSVATTFQNLGKVVGPAALAGLIVTVGVGPGFAAVGIVGGVVGAAALAGVRLTRS